MRIPEDVKEWLKNRRGVTDLYPIQRKAIEKGLFDGVSQVVSAPTGSGKTLVAEMAIANALFEGKKAIYLVPLRSLAFEKFRSLKKAFEPFKVEISVGDYYKPQVGDADILVATYERMDSLLRHSSPWLNDVGVTVIDEVHYVGDEDRGPVLETIVTQLKRKGYQIIALSATVGNLEELATWLNAELVVDYWRPVPLKEGVMDSYDYVVYFDDSEEKVIRSTKSAAYDVALHYLKKGAQVLFFANTRKRAEQSATRIASFLSPSQSSLEWAERATIEIEGELGERLAALISKGSAFHHAGLTNEARTLVEDAFRSGAIKFLAATPTLAAGVNLPAKVVVIESHMRYDQREGMVPIRVSEYKQMAGRAGRPGLDEFGISILVGKGDVDGLFEKYVKGEPEDVISSLVSTRALRRTILALLSSGFANNEEELIDFIEETLYALQESKEDALREMKIALRFLKRLGAVDERGRITEFGRLISLVYVDPLGVKIVLDGLKWRRGKAGSVGYLHLISFTPDMPKRGLRRGEIRKLQQVLLDLEPELIVRDPEDSFDWELFFSALKTALILRDWANEVPEDEIAKRYSVYPGDVRVLADTAAWLVHAYSEIARFKGMNAHAEALASLEFRMKYGVREELVELVKIPYIGRMRARKLWEHGIRSKEDLLNSDERKIARIIGPKVARRVLSALKEEPR